jgi:hypothetical protein
MNPKVFSLVLISLALFSYFQSFFLTFVDIISLFAVALATALARIVVLETELKTTTEAFKDAKTLPEFLLTRLLRQQKLGLRRLKKLWLRLLRNKPNRNKL